VEQKRKHEFEKR